MEKCQRCGRLRCGGHGCYCSEKCRELRKAGRRETQRQCRQCGAWYESPFGAKGWLCSDRCKVRGRAKINERTGCWESTLRGDKDGYTRILLGSRKDGTRRKVLLHRFSYEAFVGPVPEGLLVLHRCDNPCCANWQHLFVGTDQDNAKDSMLKGRKAKKLRPCDVRRIRKLCCAQKPPAEIARIFGVSKRQIYNILTGDQWSHVI